MNATEFLDLLKSHDWTYFYSDDSRVFNRGLQKDQLIQVTMQGRKDLQQLYDDFRSGKTKA